MADWERDLFILRFGPWGEIEGVFDHKVLSCSIALSGPWDDAGVGVTSHVKVDEHLGEGIGEDDSEHPVDVDDIVRKDEHDEHDGACYDEYLKKEVSSCF